MMLFKKLLNLPGSILSYMSNVVLKDLYLPYGGILTHIFEHFEVDLDCVEYILRTPYPSSILDQFYLTTLEQKALSRYKGKQPMESFEIIESQEVSPLSNVVLEDLNPPQVQHVAQSSNAHSLEGIYVAMQEVNSHLEGMEKHLLFQTFQTLTDLLCFLINMFSPSF